MPNAISEVLSAGKNNAQRETAYLRQIQRDLFANAETIDGAGELLPCVIALGKIERQGLEFRTAISINLDSQQQYDDVEFATNVGRLPNALVSNVIVDGLNHKLSGKFVTLPSEQSGSLDLVYTSRQPVDWLDQARLRRELAHHAMALEIVTPIIESASRSALPEPEMNPPETRSAIQRVLDSIFNR